MGRTPTSKTVEVKRVWDDDDDDDKNRKTGEITLQPKIMLK
jgi:hypothetical protein